jgi:transaldolase / glucose-6-phosphate isomerase
MSSPLETLQASAALAAEVEHEIDTWVRDRRVSRLWAKDATLWTNSGEERWLGWLDVIEPARSAASDQRALAEALIAEGVDHVLLLGMGGSSLGPEVISRVVGASPGYPRLHVLDSTDPAHVARVESEVDLRRTVVLVASKSGSTLEPNIFKQYFFVRMQEVRPDPGARFVAITDPGSDMERVATRDGFRATCHGVPSIGGRYSVLSAFGMVPAALIGVDVPRFLDVAADMASRCRMDAADNPGLMLGIVMGVAARQGRDKLTIVASPFIEPLGAWLEQLVAESTGKNGRGIVPVDLERLGESDVYGRDRLFVYLRYSPEPDVEQDRRIDALERASHPVLRIDIGDRYALAGEFFRWEVATAVAGAAIGINPFDQPDVEASKVATRALTRAFEETGALPAERPIAVEGNLQLFGDESNARAAGAANDASVRSLLRAHLDRLLANDYCALLAYLDMRPEHVAAFQSLRHLVRDRRRVATCLGFGPRFLHSTGQAYKGGPNSGVFLQVTCDDPCDLPVPGARYTFGVVKEAQARGDFDVLAERGRRALRVHLGPDVVSGLVELGWNIEGAVKS